jgi:hypothetical protein
MGKHFSGRPGFADHCRRAEFNDSRRMVGNPYLRIISGLPVIRPQSPMFEE